jgi:hypothetical protein
VLGGIVSDQPGADHCTIRVDDPSAHRRDRTVVGFCVGDLLAAVKHGGPAAHTRLGQSLRPQACLAHAAVQRCDLDLAVEAEPHDFFEIDSRSALHDEISAAASVKQPVKGRDVVERIEPSPPG